MELHRSMDDDDTMASSPPVLQWLSPSPLVMVTTASALRPGMLWILLPLGLLSLAIVQEASVLGHGHPSAFADLKANNTFTSITNTRRISRSSSSTRFILEPNELLDAQRNISATSRTESQREFPSKLSDLGSSQASLLGYKETGGQAHVATASNNLLQPEYSLKQGTTSVQTDNGDLPAIVWLASYPNSGTSYTMTLMAGATGLSTATNYGFEVTPRQKGTDSVPIHASHPEGPYWAGTAQRERRRVIRPLPTTRILTKTHCGARCVKCGAAEYVANATTFLQGCEKTSEIRNGVRAESHMQASRVQGLVHLLRHPLHNIVARFHLERRHAAEKHAVDETHIVWPNNAAGFRQWCAWLDEEFSDVEQEDMLFSKVYGPQFFQVWREVPYCRAEFFKYVQWHNLLLESIPYMGRREEMRSSSSNNHQHPIPVLTIHYEDYATNLTGLAQALADFLQQPLRALNQTAVPAPASSLRREHQRRRLDSRGRDKWQQRRRRQRQRRLEKTRNSGASEAVPTWLRDFRELPDYSDYYTPEGYQSVARMMQDVASRTTWSLIQRYF